jgi:hypothetical protein
MFEIPSAGTWLERNLLARIPISTKRRLDRLLARAVIAPVLLALCSPSTVYADVCDTRMLILMLDVSAIQSITERSTSASREGPGKNTFQSGLETLLGKDDLEGRLAIYKIRDKSAERIARTCLEAIPADMPKQSREPGGLIGTLMKWYEGKDSDDDERQRLGQTIERLLHERRDLAAFLDTTMKKETAAPAAKDLLTSSISVMQSECGNSNECRVFIFSDLRDMRTKILSDNNRPQSADYFRNMGSQDADLVRRNLNAQKSSSPIYFKIWGQDLGSEDQRKLTQYWVGAFSALNPPQAPEPDIRARFGW